MNEDVMEALSLLDTVPESEWNTKTGEHGKLIEVRVMPYHDVFVYEDGYEFWNYIGE